MSGSSSTIRIPEHVSPSSGSFRRRRFFGTTSGLSNDAREGLRMGSDDVPRQCGQAAGRYKKRPREDRSPSQLWLHWRWRRAPCTPRRRPPTCSNRARCSASATGVEPNITYLTVNGWNARLDLYLPLHATAPAATFVYFHGGGWVTGSKDESALEVLPYLAMGFAVVNVDYRLAQVAPAPAAAEDARCALRWVFRHAQQYGLDPGASSPAGCRRAGTWRCSRRWRPSPPASIACARATRTSRSRRS